MKIPSYMITHLNSVVCCVLFWIRPEAANSSPPNPDFLRGASSVSMKLSYWRRSETETCEFCRCSHLVLDNKTNWLCSRRQRNALSKSHWSYSNFPDFFNLPNSVCRGCQLCSRLLNFSTDGIIVLHSLKQASYYNVRMARICVCFCVRCPGAPRGR